MRETILPGKPEVAEEGEKAPYPSEFILLSFEGHHKPFEVVYELYGKRPSYAPPAFPAGDEAGVLNRLKTKLTLLCGGK